MIGLRIRRAIDCSVLTIVAAAGLSGCSRGGDIGAGPVYRLGPSGYTPDGTAGRTAAYPLSRPSGIRPAWDAAYASSGQGS